MEFEDRTEMANRQRDLDEAQQTVEDYTCGECSSHLKIELQPDGSVQPVCRMNSRHAGYRIIEGALAIADRDLSATDISDNQEMRSPMLRGETSIAVIGEMATRFQLSTNEANVFFAHCVRLNLDPFLGMIAPLAYKSHGGARVRTVIPFPTEKGWGALAKRSEPEEFMGPPTLRPIPEDEKGDWGYGVGDIVYEAKGNKRSWGPGVLGGQVITAFTVDKIAKAKQYGTVSGEDPHHHCRVMATRRWYEHNYPDATTRVSMAVEELPAEVISVIEGEYRVIEEGEGRPGISAPAQSGGSGGGDNVTQAQMDHILRLANSNFGMNEEDVVRHKLNGNPLSSLSKSRASELIDHLKSEGEDGPRQGELGDT